jgi:alpha-L-rhamnosidase
MKIVKMKTNHLVNPLGYAFDPPFVSWVVEETMGKKQKAARVTVKKGESPEEGTVVFDSGQIQDISNLGYELPIKPEPYTRYFWRVSVWADNGDHAESEWAFFETAKIHNPWTARWIRADLDKDLHPCLRKTFHIPGKVRRARAYVCGLGLYELEINGQKAGDEYLMPGYHAYDSFVQYQTCDVTALLREGENVVGIMLAPGWYKGRFVFEGGFTNLYGDTMELICELRIRLSDGRELVINSGTDWEGRPSPVKASSIYDGEEYHAAEAIPRWSGSPEGDAGGSAGDEADWLPAVLSDRGVSNLRERINPPLRIHEQLKPEKLITTDSGEQVLDFGQEITGWVSFRLRENKPGAAVRLSYSEIMQGGRFYRDNLRTARAEHIYIGDGKEALVRPHFTFFGFRYVKVEGIPDIDTADFTANAIYSDIEQTGWIETSDPNINRLISNILWSQKDNFLDIPTDCPQRDERMGWTGDVAVFCETAHQNMYTPAFFNHFMENIRVEQEKQGGAVTLFVPVPKPKEDEGKDRFSFGKVLGMSVWGDVGSILPWTLYVMYGSRPLLARHYGVIKDWAEYVIARDNEAGGNGLWKTGIHLGDWLSLDKEDTQDPRGSTDVYFIASAFYFNTLQIAAKVAGVLNLMDDQKYYHARAEKVRKAFIAAYFNADGTLAIGETQTALVVALYFGLFPPGAAVKLLDALVARIRAKGNHLDTGFVGTPYLCPVLSKYGAGNTAYSLLLQNTCPSWLYEVGMGATTIWERWNSVLPDGKISGTRMNSLNHYAYGSIGNWLYRYVCGLNPVEESPGFKQALFAPQPDPRLKSVRLIRDTPAGRYEAAWNIGEDGVVSYTLTVPFDCEVTVALPEKEYFKVSAGTYHWNC